MIRVQLDTTPLLTGHAHRGIGRYTQELKAELSKLSELQLVEPDVHQVQKPDVIHYPFFDLFFPSLPVKKLAPTVVTVHDVIPLQFPKFYKAGIRGSAVLWRQRWLLQKVDAVITDSLASKQEIMRYLGIPESKLFVVPLAGQADIKTSNQKKIAAVAHKYRLPPAYLLYVGDINYNKNLPQLIKAMKFIPEHIHLVCVGKNFVPQPIPEWKWIEQQLAMSNVEKRVHFLTEIGGQQIDELAALYSGALAYVQPSLAEGFGLPVLEAMQCRVPVVIAPAAALIEVASNHAVTAGFSAEELAQGVNTVARWSDRARQSFTRAGLQWASQFTWEKVVLETSKVYAQVARRS